MKIKPLPKYNYCDNKAPIKEVTIEGLLCFINGKYFGDVVEILDNELKVECNSGNKYMKGTIVTLQYITND